MTLRFTLICLVVGFTGPLSAAEEASQLLEGSLASAVQSLDAKLKTNPKDDQARFALGMAQSLRAVEKLGGKFYEHGLNPKGLGQVMPMLRLPVPENPSPKETSIEDVDAMLDAFVTDLDAARKTLEQVRDPSVKLPVRIGMIRLDLNGDAPGDEKPLWELAALAQLNVTRDQAETYTINFDVGDARWLE